MKDLIATDIDWKMLTMKRPVSKIDEEYFSRVVEMKRLEHKTKLEDGYGPRKNALKFTRHPRTLYRYRSHDIDTMDFDLVPDIDYESYARDDPDENQMNHDQVENANELVAKLLGDDFSDNFTSGKDKELAENVRRKSSVKKLAAGNKAAISGGKKSPVQSSGHKREIEKKPRTDSPLPTNVPKRSPKENLLLNPKEDLVKKKSGSALNDSKRASSSNSRKRVPPSPSRGARPGQKSKRDKPETKSNAQVANEEVAQVEVTEEKMEEEKEDENRFASTWIDATKEKVNPTIVVTGTLPGE